MARSPSPHGFNRICNNDLLYKQPAGPGEYPVGAAAVKELYDADQKTIIGYAVEVHTSAGNDTSHWYWYERNPTLGAPPKNGMAGVVADGIGPDEGVAGSPTEKVCTGCHSAAGSDKAHQTGDSHDFVYTHVPLGRCDPVPSISRRRRREVHAGQGGERGYHRAPPMSKPRLHGTPLSHFTRKARILLAELAVDHDFVRVGGVLGGAPADYADNPLMRVPTLVHEGRTLIDSDHIARYLVSRFDPADRLRVRGEDVDGLNRLAVANGIMANEVVLILAKRGGLVDLDGVAYFRKLRAAMESGLGWLDARVDPDADGFDYGDVAAICMWQHVRHYALVPDLERYPRLAARVDRFATRPSVASTTPEASLAEATAAGWRPA
jgi:glutathione S-transferase